MSQTRKKLLVDPLVDNNPIALQVLGICSAEQIPNTCNAIGLLSTKGSTSSFFLV